MDQAKLKSEIEKFLAVADFLAKITPSAVDNNAVAVIRQAINNDTIMGLLFFVYSKFLVKQDVVAFLAQHISK